MLPDICTYDGMPAMSFLQNDLAAAVLSSKSEPALEDLEAALETTTVLTRASFDVVYTPENGDEKAAFEARRPEWGPMLLPRVCARSPYYS